LKKREDYKVHQCVPITKKKKRTKDKKGIKDMNIEKYILKAKRPTRDCNWNTKNKLSTPNQPSVKLNFDGESKGKPKIGMG